MASGSSETKGPLKDWRFAAAALLCILAIFSKPAAITAPILLWLVVRYARPSWKAIHVLVMIVPIAIAGAFTVITGVPDLQSQGAVVERSVLGNAFDMLRAWTIHASHLVWPRHLLAEYERSSTALRVWRLPSSDRPRRDGVGVATDGGVRSSACAVVRLRMRRSPVSR